MEEFDVIIIGGGITGATGAKHLSAAGYSVLLLEAKDFGSGTSSRTSRLQYCGLAYLTGFESLASIARRPKIFAERLGLAKISMRERSAFAKASPHRLQSVEFVIPLFRDRGASAWKMRAAHRMLDLLDNGGVGLHYQFIPRSEIASHPLLSCLARRDQLDGAIRYSEFQYNWPERICLDTIMSASAASATVLNYSPLKSLHRRDNGWEATFLDGRTGALKTARSRAVVNAAGPWVDDVARDAGLSAPRVNQGEKGSNIVMRLPAEYRGMGVQTQARNGAPFYIIPWGALHYIGPVNRVQDATPDGFVVSDAEKLALVEEMNHLFPALKLSPGDIVYSWAGVRPRTYEKSSVGASIKLHTPRETGLPNYFAYTGGLLMMHQRIGHQIEAGLLQSIPPSGQRKTLDAWVPRAASHLDTSSAMSPTEEQCSFLVNDEKALNLDDLMFRRLPYGWNDHLGTDRVNEVAAIMASIAHWSPAERDRQLKSYQRLIEDQFGYAPKSTS